MLLSTDVCSLVPAVIVMQQSVLSSFCVSLNAFRLVEFILKAEQTHIYIFMQVKDCFKIV